MKSQLYSEDPGAGRPADPILQGGRCRCGYVFFPMQVYGCERCGSRGNALTPQPLSTRGTLLASALVHLHADKSRPAPFTIVKVALDDGPVVRTLLADDSCDIVPGQRMTAKLVSLQRDDGETVFDLRFVAAG
ncbi:hypothetical protein [Bradyrhizobium sp. NAS96.2]|uniref:Zn-ribbon domain-containing OB-fold protein n=1 Tax=Bradyrhizobium sp. NAS96.2 TaxID=1680160 RepID=UPI0009FB24D6|nr:hypothetical protein [Bradyrhizobium sp. NAS96.2]